MGLFIHQQKCFCPVIAFFLLSSPFVQTAAEKPKTLLTLYINIFYAGFYEHTFRFIIHMDVNWYQLKETHTFSTSASEVTHAKLIIT